MQLNIRNYSEEVNKALGNLTHDGGLQMMQLINAVISNYAEKKDIGSKGRFYVYQGSDWHFRTTKKVELLLAAGGFEILFQLTAKDKANVKINLFETFEPEEL